MIPDYHHRRLYREIMREAILLGDKFLVEMVLVRLAELARPSMVSGTKSNIISFPNDHLSTMPAFRKPQSLWVTVLLTTLIPLGMFLILTALHFLSLFCMGSCKF